MFTHPRSRKWKASLIELDSDSSGWIRYFRDPETNQEWAEYYPYDDDRSPSFMRHRELPDDLEELLHTCLTSKHKDEWIGVAAYVSNAFKTTEIANILEKIAPNIPQRRLKVFGKYYHAYDNRNVVGMYYTEVENSYQKHLDAIQKINSITQIG